MSRKTQIGLQSLGFLIQTLNLNQAILPPNAQKYVTLGVALTQGFLAILQANSNPDGTPAVVAYVPPPSSISGDAVNRH